MTSTQTLLMSEIVKHCVAPACNNWPRRAFAVHDFAGDRRQNGNFRDRRCVRDLLEMGDSENAQRLLSGGQVGLRLIFRSIRLPANPLRQ